MNLLICSTPRPDVDKPTRRPAKTADDALELGFRKFDASFASARSATPAPEHGFVEMAGGRRRLVEGQQETREAFLDAAERNFAERGYAAASLREIAQDADLNPAMASYWFGGKLDMFKEVYLRRGTWLAARRMELLAAETSRSDADIEDFLRAYLLPAFELRANVQGRAFLRIQTRLHAEPDELAYDLRRRVYDGPVRAYVAALRRLIPGLTEVALTIRFAQFVGIYLYILSDAHRIDQMGKRPRATPSSRTLVEQIVRFAAAGMRA